MTVSKLNEAKTSAPSNVARGDTVIIIEAGFEVEQIVPGSGFHTANLRMDAKLV